MSEISERYKKVAGGFTQRADEVPDGAWDNPAPCEGWVARDVVRHMVEWMPSMVLENVGISLPANPSVDDDPAGAWRMMSDTIQAALEDPAVATLEFETLPGTFSMENAVANFCIGDILVHTWDLARATGLDETIDADEVHRLVDAMEPMDEVLRQSGHYGPRVDVPADADEQTRLIAFTGRQPSRT
jgi:uncharacterized protein (TIGR03086 family)